MVNTSTDVEIITNYQSHQSVRKGGGGELLLLEEIIRLDWYM